MPWRTGIWPVLGPDSKTRCVASKLQPRSRLRSCLRRRGERRPPAAATDCGTRWSAVCTILGSSSDAKAGTFGMLVRPGCDDHVLGLEALVTCGDDEPAAGLREPVDRDAGSHRELELLGIVLEVVGHLVLRGERPPKAGETHARQPAEVGGSEETKRVPALAPGVADSLVRVQDHERRSTLRQVIAGRQAGLARRR